MRKKVFFISNYFGNGGAATVMREIAMYFSHNYNYDVTIFAFNSDDFIYDVPDGVNYIVLNSNKKNLFLKKLSQMKLLRKYIENDPEASIISFEYFINIRTILASLFLPNRLIISERNDPSRVGNNRKKLRNFLYRFSDVLVCQTQDAKNYFPKYIKRKSVVILNPLNPDLPNVFIGSKEKTIVNFCRLEKQKNLKMLIDAFAIVNKKYPNYKLKIYGEGNEKDELIDYINNMKLKNIFIYPFNNNIHQVIKKSSMFVSSSNYEGLSNSMLEAMAMGLPTICTDCPCGGARMIIKDGENGILTDVGNVNMLSEKMIKIIEDTKLQDRLSVNAAKLRDTLSIDNIAEKWDNII